jgi:diaminohydroxyphosphoribosylaminopyrimidine deaminase/5-amino-6-(5-phosphoribosylamino)uracil reductase
LDVLYQNQIQSIIIEGGRQTLQSFIDENLWDEARIFVGKMNFLKGTRAPIITRKNTTKTNILSDELIQIRNHD